MKTPGFLILAAFVAGCAPHHPPLGTSVQRSLDMQSLGESPHAIDENARRAEEALSRWPADAGLNLSLEIREAAEELELTAHAGKESDPRYSTSLVAFHNAIELVCSSPTTLAAKDLEAVSALVRTARSDALAARGQDPTAVSPTNSLKTLRKHQTAPSHYDY